MADKPYNENNRHIMALIVFIKTPSRVELRSLSSIFVANEGALDQTTLGILFRCVQRSLA
jgi:hypothetical protein